MNNKTNLQVPMSLTLKTQAEELAEKQGFSSLQELVRVFITHFTNGGISVMFNNTLSPQMLDVYAKDLEDTKREIKRGDIKIHKSAKSAINHLFNL